MTTRAFAAAALAALAATPALAESRTYDLGAFTAIDLTDGIAATIVTGSEQSIIATALDPAVLDDLRVVVHGDRLYANLEGDFWDWLSFRNEDVQLTITVTSALTGITASASSEVRVDSTNGDELTIQASSSAEVAIAEAASARVLIDASSSSDVTIQSADIANVSINASSSSEVNLAGTCDDAVANVSSSATIEAGTLQCVDLRVDASSSSDSRFFATGNVTAYASSSAKVEVLGSPARVDQDVSSSAEIDII